MKLATYRNGDPDGQLVVVSRDLSRAIECTWIARNLLQAMDNWNKVAPELERLSDAINTGQILGAKPFEPSRCMAPMPRSFQWCDASAFLNHGRLMERAFNTAPIPDSDTVPLMYQGASDDFLGPCDPVPMPEEALGIDFEGEFGVVTGPVPMGATPEVAERAIRLVVQLNDWSLRGLGPREMKTGFGFFQAKPSTSFAPVAVTPDELGEHWQKGRVHLDLEVTWNGERFGHPNGGEMHFSFGELLAHAARTRKLGAGTIVGTGTVSNAGGVKGSACIAERRVIEILAHGTASTRFMRFGDRVRMCARTPNGETPFGAIEQTVTQS